MSFFLENCFGCLRLRTGVLILGYLHLIAVVVLFIMHIIMMITFHFNLGAGYGRDAIVNGLTIVIAFIFSYMVTVALLIYGATKGNRHYMLPFIAVLAFESVYVVCYELLCCFYLVSMFLSLGLGIIFVAFTVFEIWILLSHHHELKKYTLDSREDDEVSIVNAGTV